jgi:hypothetical protein
MLKAGGHPAQDPGVPDQTNEKSYFLQERGGQNAYLSDLPLEHDLAIGGE